MILCLGCKRLWARGTVFCGQCRASLGRPVCPKGHKSPKAARCCTTCGNSDLSRSVRALSLRPVTLIVVVALSLKAASWSAVTVAEQVHQAIPALVRGFVFWGIACVCVAAVGGKWGRKAAWFLALLPFKATWSGLKVFALLLQALSDRRRRVSSR